MADICEYKILGCATSDFHAAAAPFALVIMARPQEKAAITGLVVSDWETRFGALPEYVHAAVRSLLNDLEDYRRGDETERFFRHLETLGVGAIRTLTEGSGSWIDLRRVICESFEEGDLNSVSTEPQSSTTMRVYGSSALIEDVLEYLLVAKKKGFGLGSMHLRV